MSRTINNNWLSMHKTNYQLFRRYKMDNDIWQRTGDEWVANFNIEK
jgi:hypothetical protein